MFEPDPFNELYNDWIESQSFDISCSQHGFGEYWFVKNKVESIEQLVTLRGTFRIPEGNGLPLRLITLNDGKEEKKLSVRLPDSWLLETFR